MSAPLLRVGYLFNEAAVVGGGELSFIDLADAIRAQGVEPLAYVPAEGEVTDALRSRGLPWRVWPWPPVRWYRGVQCLRHARQTAALFAEDRLALVHANGARCMLYAGPAARRAGIPCVWHVRVLQRDFWLDRFRARHARVIMANSRAVAATLRAVAATATLRSGDPSSVVVSPRRVEASSLRSTSATPVEVVYNGFDLARLRAAAPLDMRDLFQLPAVPVVLGVGRFSRWKGFDDLLRACALLQQEGMSVACVLAGRAMPGEETVEAGLKTLAETLGLRHVRFAGWRADTPGLMKTAAVLAVPSHGEPFGRVIVEGWACGVPVVATRAGGPAELIRDGEDGLLVDVRRPDRLADAIRRVVTDPDCAGRLSQSGQRRAQAFSLDAHAETVARAYRNALAPGGSE